MLYYNYKNKGKDTSPKKFEMKKFDFCEKDYDDVKVICKHDGEIAYCNALAVNGLCKCSDCVCKCAIAVIVTKNSYTRYLSLED